MRPAFDQWPNPAQVLEREAANGFRGFASFVQPVEWAREHFRLSSESSHTQGTFVPAPYQEGFINLLASDAGPEKVVIQKSARIGYTTSLLSTICYMFGQSRRHVAVYMPDDDTAKRFMKNTIMPSLRECEKTQDLLDEQSDLRSDRTLKDVRLGGKLLRVMGSVSATRFREYTADVVLMDEADALRFDVGEEGDPVSLAYRAIKNSPFRRLVVGGTPTLEGGSLVNDEYLAAALRLKYYIPCPHCKALQTLEWQNMKWPGKEEGYSKEIAARKSMMMCTSCGSLWSYQQMQVQCRHGHWRVPDVFPGKDGEDPEPEDFAGYKLTSTMSGPVLEAPGGEVVEWPSSVALHINALYSPFWAWENCVVEWLAAQGNKQKMKVFVNHTLGLPWRDQTARLYHLDLLARQEHLMPLPERTVLITAAVDVQEDRLSMLIVGWAKGEEMLLLERLEFPGDTSMPGGSSWQALLRWIRSDPTWDVEDGSRIELAALAIDSGFRTDTVYLMERQLSLAMGGKFVMVLKGSSRQSHPISKRSQSKDKAGNVSIRLWIVGSYQAGVTVLGRLSDPEKCKIGSALSKEAVKELCSTSLEVYKKTTGHRGMKLVGHGPDEAYDCLVYNLCLVRSLGINLDNPVRKNRVGSPDGTIPSDKDIEGREPVRRSRRTGAGRMRSTWGGRTSRPRSGWGHG